MVKFYLEDRLRGFARMITGNYRLKVIFTGDTAFITKDAIYIPALENTKAAFSKAKYLVAHECGHESHSDLSVKERVSKKSVLLGDILNSLEDARIENLMTAKFQGLLSLFDAEIRKIISENDYAKVPLTTQIIHGLYMKAKGYDSSVLKDEAKSLLSCFDDCITDAINSKDSSGVLSASERIYEKLKHLEKEHESGQQKIKASDNIPVGKSLPDMVIERLRNHRIDPDYDNMKDYPHLKDENSDEAETEVSANSHHISEYMALIRHHTSHCSFLVQHLKNIMETRRSRCRRKTIQTMQSSGSMDTKRLWKLATGDDRIMKTRLNRMGFRDEVDPDSMAIYILLDESFSMKDYERIQYAKQAVALLGEVLNNLCVPFAITGYSASGQLKRILYKQFDESYIDVRTRLAEARSRDGTYTQEHIPYALRRLDSRRERKKILLVVTDSEEVESEFRFGRAKFLAKESGVELLGLGINTSVMGKYFDRFFVLNDLQRFGEELLRLFRDAITKKASVVAKD